MIWNRFIRTEAACLIITAVVAAGLIYATPSRWFELLLLAFIYSHCIGLSISTLVHVTSGRLARLHLIPRLVALFLIFLFGGLFGTEAGNAIQRLFLGVIFYPDDHRRLLMFNLFLSAVFGSLVVIYFSLRATVEGMAKKLKEKEMNEERLMRRNAQAELDALQAKINPHFLFNTLNSIASLIAENPAVAESTVEKLSELFRYTLQRSGTGLVKLSEELQIVRSYLEIEQIRFGNRLTFEINCDERLANTGIPALLIQPLVENSIKHGIANELRGGSIHIETSMGDGQCVIVVEDSGSGFTAPIEETGFGLKSIRERLKLVYGEKASLEIGHDGTTRIQISIPLS